MGERAWKDVIVNERMQVDQEFEPRIRESQFTKQEWGLIMTAVDFEIEGDGDNARLVADTSQIEDILPEVEKLRTQGEVQGAEKQSSGGFFTSIKSALGVGKHSKDKSLEEATRLANEYASDLQARLESNGKWGLVRGLA